MSKAKKYNPQAIANVNVLNKYGFLGIKDELEKDVREFCLQHPIKKTRDFVYKSDYFTPRNMYLINPLYYAYYTNLVFKIFSLLTGNDSQLDFSNERMSIFYSGLFKINSSEKVIQKNAMFNKSYQSFQKVRENYFGKPVLAIDLQDFFNSIKIKSLIKKLREKLGRQKAITDLEYFFEYCGFEYLPQLHYSIASSILSQFYLVDFDSKMLNLLEREDLHLIRFVDDMFIIHLDGQEDVKKNNNLLNEISYYLWQEGLVLNSSKTKLLSPEEYKTTVEVIEAQYGEIENSFSSPKRIDKKTEEIINNGDLIEFIEKLCELEESNGVDLKRYKELVDEYIAIEGEDSRKVINNIMFSKKWRGLDVDILMKIIENWKYILFNPTQFTIFYILVCRHLESQKIISGKRIKRILNYLFRNDNFTFRDTLVAVAYLFQNQNKNKELLNKIELVNSEYVDFIDSFI
jgi:hypothetical protein